MKREDFRESWSALHGGIEISPIVSAWLEISRPIATFCAKVKLSANSITFLGLLASLAMWRTIWHPYSFIFLALSILFDGVDGSLAIINGTSGKWGGVLDSVADRIAEFFWAVALYDLGATWWIVGVAWLAAFVQEYVRARLASLDGATINFVSICERPVRAIFVGVAIIFSIYTNNYVGKVAVFWSSFQVVALVTVLMNAFTRLKTIHQISDELGTDSDEG